MANVRITDLDLIPFSSITIDDVFPIVDITDDVTYKIDLEQLGKYLSGFNNRWYIESGETITVRTNTQSFIYGDLFIYGELVLEDNSKLFVVNGNIELISGGTITGDGTTHLIDIPEFDTYVTGGTYSAGTATFINNKGGIFTVSGFYSGTTDGITTGATFNEYSGIAKFKDNVGSEFDLTGLTISNFIYIPSGETITVEKNTQKFVYGDIIIDGDLVLKDDSQLLVLNGDVIVSGGTISGTGDIISVDLPEIDTKVTGFTYHNNVFTILNNFGSSYSVTLDEMSGLTINGVLSADTINAFVIDLCSTNGALFTDSISGCSPIDILSETHFYEGLSATTISGGTFYGDGSNLSGISTQDVFVTGGTYSNGDIIFTNNTGGTFDVTGFYTGGTDVFVTGGTYSAGTATFTNTTGGTFNVSGFSESSLNGLTGQITFFDSSTSVFGSNNLVYSGGTLQVKATGNTTSDFGFKVRYSGDDRDLLKINGLGKATFGFDTSALDGFTIDPQNAEFSQTAYGGIKVMSLTNSQGYVGYGVGAYKFGIGTNSPQSRLDVRAQGTLSTDIALGVRNNGDTINLLQIQGDGGFVFRNNGNTGFFYYDGANGWQQYGSSTTLATTVGSTTTIRTNGAFIGIGPNSHVLSIYDSGNFQLEQSAGIVQTSGQGGLSLKNGTAPSSNTTDRFTMYSSDIIAGNASPHFRTETGDIVKLYKNVDAALVNVPNTGDANTDALITALKNIIINTGLGASS